MSDNDVTPPLGVKRVSIEDVHGYASREDPEPPAPEPMRRVEVKSDGTTMNTHVFVDGKELEVRSLRFHARAGHHATLTVELHVDKFEIDGDFHVVNESVTSRPEKPCMCPYECASKGGCDCRCHDAWRKSAPALPPPPMAGGNIDPPGSFDTSDVTPTKET